MKKIIITVFGLVLSLSASAKDSLSVHFPYFAGKYTYLGSEQNGGIDTLAHGMLDKDGRIRLALPEGLGTQPHMLQWGIEENRINLIVEGSMGVECLEEMPSEQSIRYINAPQNSYKEETYARMNNMLRQYGALMQLKDYYPENTAVGKGLQTEQTVLQERYAAMQNEISSNPGFAARYLDILRFMRGVPSSFTIEPDQWQAEQRHFAAHKLDYGTLYRSDVWSHFGEKWIGNYTNYDTPVPDAELLADCRAILERTPDKQLYTAIAEMFVLELTKKGRDYVLNTLVIDMSLSGRLEGASMYLRSLTQVVKGGKVPALVGLKNKPELKGQTSLLFFYDSHCYSCRSEIDVLKKEYAKLAKKGIRVISIAADSDPVQYDNYAAAFPWPDKIMDGKGTEGENFTNYGVVGSPALLVVDKKGLLTGKYVNLKTTGLIE